MSKLYFEMTDTERELTYLGQTVDYAGTRFAEGLSGTYEALSTKEVIDIQSKITEHLFEASSLIRKLLNDTPKLDEEENEEDMDDDIHKPIIILNSIGGANEMKELTDCKVYHIQNIEKKEQDFYGTIITFFNEKIGKYIDLLKDDDGGLSMSQWY